MSADLEYLQQCVYIIKYEHMKTRAKQSETLSSRQEKTKEQILFGDFLYWVTNILLTVFVSLSSFFSYLTCRYVVASINMFLSP